MLTRLDSFNPVIIGGAGRSGTTLLRSMLGCHSSFVATNEFKFLPSIASLRRQFTQEEQLCGVYHLDPVYLDTLFGLLICSLLEPIQAEHGGRRLIEKTPHNIEAFDVLGRILKHARFIHVIRDGRDVACSLVHHTHWRDAKGNPLWYTKDIEGAAKYWKILVTKGRAFGNLSYLKPRYLEVRYEDMICEPETTLRSVLDFVGEPWQDSVLDTNKRRELSSRELPESSTHQVKEALYTQALGRWKSDMTESDKCTFERIAGDLLRGLGYCDDSSWSVN